MARYREVPEDTVLWVMIIFLTIIIDVLYFYWHLLKHDHYYDYGDQHPIAISTMTTGTIIDVLLALIIIDVLLALEH